MNNITDPIQTESRIYFVQLLVTASAIYQEFLESKAVDLQRWFDETQVCHCGQCHPEPRNIVHEITQHLHNETDIDAEQERIWIDRIVLIMPELEDEPENEDHNKLNYN